MVNIGILGAGTVGKTLALWLTRLGYQVAIGSRNQEHLQQWKEQENFSGTIWTYEEVAVFGDAIILAVKGKIADEVLTAAGKDNLNEKVVIDTTNPIEEVEPEDGVLQYFTNMNFSLMERLQNHVPHARFVKCFSCIGAAHMIQPQFTEGKPTMFICGNDTDAKTIATEIAQRCGFDVADMGTAKSAGAIEALCMLRCIPGFTHGDRNHAFRLIRS